MTELALVFHDRISSLTRCRAWRLSFRLDSWSIKALFVWAVLSTLSCGYPSLSEVEQRLSYAMSRTSAEERSKKVEQILLSLADPSDKSDDKLIEQTVHMLAERYQRSLDDAILVSVDRVNLDGGFGTFICSFYTAVQHLETVKIRYQAPRFRGAVKRCDGISDVRL